MKIPSRGYGEVVIFKNKNGTMQLRDDLSRFWCACGQPAVDYFEDHLEGYRFKCVKHADEARQLEESFNYGQ